MVEQTFEGTETITFASFETGIHTKVLSYGDLKEELIIFLRNNLTDPNARGTAGSNVWTAGGISGNFTLSQLGVKNISSVTVDGIAQTGYVDYTPNYQNNSPSSYPTINLASVPLSGLQVQVNYKYGETWIYPDWPRTDLGLSTYPRVSMDLTSKRTEPFGIGGEAVKSDILFSITAFADKSSTIDSILSETGSAIIHNIKNFHYFQGIFPSSMGPEFKEPERNEKIVMRTADFIIPHLVEK
jgi:hypothetical protein